MCGIAGFVNVGAEESTESMRQKLERMVAVLAHRGPDDEGQWIRAEQGVALGHRRLSIIDLSPLGHQPMSSNNGQYCFAFNGELYNHSKLKADLEQQGVRFRGQSDTEVLLAAIASWGIDKALDHSIGMYAFALWDKESGVLYLARDRMGEKPLYYGLVPGALLFGSELKALRVHPAWRGEIDRGALTLFMRYNYIPAPWSIYRGVYKLPPGCVLKVPRDRLARRIPLNPFPDGADRDDMAPYRYWKSPGSLALDKTGSFEGSPTDAIDVLEKLLSNSVKHQMVSDVPLGALLSGGIDSSTVVSLMQANHTRPVRTFSIGFREQEYDEARQAKSVASHLGTDHTELYVTPDDAMKVIPELPQIYDEPFSDSSQIPTYLVASLARQHVTVALSGDGGDELFGGYNRYFWGMSIWRKLGWIPAPVRTAAATGLQFVSPAVWDSVFKLLGPALPRYLRQVAAGDKLHKLSEVLNTQLPDDLYLRLVSHWKEPARLVRGGFEPDSPMREAMKSKLPHGQAQRMMYFDTISYLPDDILVKVDRASMRVSLEVRVPLLDHHIVEFAAKLPLSMKISGGKGKWLLRQLLYRYVPRDLVDRPKMGFGVPLDSWLRGSLREWAEDLLEPGRMSREAYLDPVPVQEKWREHLGGGRNWQYYLWDVLMFQSWLRENG
jgi:asparagine synthase (glutamine-hydrolysing)